MQMTRLLGLLENITFSASNFLLLAIVSQSVSAERAGNFTTLAICLIASAVITRSLLGLVQLTSADAQKPAGYEGATFLLGFVTLLATFALLLPFSDFRLAAAFALAGGAATVQDAARHSALRCLNFARSILGNVLWVLALSMAWPLHRYVPMRVETAVLIAWSIGALICFFWLEWRGAAEWYRPSFRNCRKYFEATYAKSKLFLTEQTIGPLNGIAASVVAAAIVGAEEFGAVRIAQTAVGPMGIILQGMSNTMTAEFVDDEREDLVSHAKMLGVRFAFLSLTVLGISSIALYLVGDFVFGEIWTPARRHLIPLVAFNAAVSLRIGLIAMYRARGHLKILRAARLREGSLVAAASIAGAATSGVLGFSIGAAIAGVVATYFWYHSAKSVQAIVSQA